MCLLPSKMFRFVVLCVVVCFVQANAADVDCGENASHKLNIGCEKTCETLPEGILCATAPKESCICDDGFVRDRSSNKCVKKEDCAPPDCGENAHYVDTIGCEPSCEHPVLNFPCAAAPHKACKCLEGFVRNKAENNCIKVEDCPK